MKSPERLDEAIRKTRIGIQKIEEKERGLNALRGASKYARGGKTDQEIKDSIRDLRVQKEGLQENLAELGFARGFRAPGERPVRPYDSDSEVSRPTPYIVERDEGILDVPMPPMRRAGEPRQPVGLPSPLSRRSREAPAALGLIAAEAPSSPLPSLPEGTPAEDVKFDAPPSFPITREDLAAGASAVGNLLGGAYKLAKRFAGEYHNDDEAKRLRRENHAAELREREAQEAAARAEAEVMAARAREEAEARAAELNERQRQQQEEREAKEREEAAAREHEEADRAGRAALAELQRQLGAERERSAEIRRQGERAAAERQAEAARKQEEHLAGERRAAAERIARAELDHVERLNRALEEEARAEPVIQDEPSTVRSSVSSARGSAGGGGGSIIASHRGLPVTVDDMEPLPADPDEDVAMPLPPPPRRASDAAVILADLAAAADAPPPPPSHRSSFAGSSRRSSSASIPMAAEAEELPTEPISFRPEDLLSPETVKRLDDLFSSPDIPKMPRGSRASVGSKRGSSYVVAAPPPAPPAAAAPPATALPVTLVRRTKATEEANNAGGGGGGGGAPSMGGSTAVYRDEKKMAARLKRDQEEYRKEQMEKKEARKALRVKFQEPKAYKRLPAAPAPAEAAVEAEPAEPAPKKKALGRPKKVAALPPAAAAAPEPPVLEELPEDHQALVSLPQAPTPSPAPSRYRPSYPQMMPMFQQNMSLPSDPYSESPHPVMTQTMYWQ